MMMINWIDDDAYDDEIVVGDDSDDYDDDCDGDGHGDDDDQDANKDDEY